MDETVRRTLVKMMISIEQGELWQIFEKQFLMNLDLLVVLEYLLIKWQINSLLVSKNQMHRIGFPM